MTVANRKMLLLEVNTRGVGNHARFDILRARGYDIFYLTTSAVVAPYPFAAVRRANSIALDDISLAAGDWHAEIGFDGVMTVDEASVIALGRISKELGLPGPSTEAARNSRNKWYMRCAHREGRAPHPQFARTDTLEEALEAAEVIGYPVILKPTLGAFSQHVHKIAGPADMKRLFGPAMTGSSSYSFRNMEAETEELGPCTLLVEEFLDGSEHMVEAVIDGETLHIGAISDRLSLESDTFDDDLYKMPTSLDAAQIALIREAVRLGAIAQGITLGTMHAEVRFHRGKPHIVEIAARPGGGSIQYTSVASYGYNPMDAAITVAEGRCPEIGPLCPTGDVSIALTMLCGGGRIERLEVPSGIRNQPGVINFQMAQTEGNIVHRPPHGNDVLGFLGVKAPSLEETLQIADRIVTSLKIKLGPLEMA